MDLRETGDVQESNTGNLSAGRLRRVAKRVSAPVVHRTVGVLLIVRVDTDPEGVCVVFPVTSALALSCPYHTTERFHHWPLVHHHKNIFHGSHIHGGNSWQAPLSHRS